MKTYQSPLTSRYGSKEMRALFSDHHKFTTWRKVWLELARAQKELGLNISDAQIQQLERYVHDLNLDVAQQYEDVLFHDVMAQLHAFGDQAVDAKGILHLGATSAFVSDNAEILIQQQAMVATQQKVVSLVQTLSERIKQTADITVVGFTHYQVAQPTTFGKRLAMYLQDFMSDLQLMDHWFDTLMLRGVKGTTGTAASFLELFNHDEEKVRQLDSMFANKFKIHTTYPITGQTYPRKRDSLTLSVLSNIAQSAHKLAVDFRLMQHDLLLHEPFRKTQVGSSAMAYKRNPIMSEKITGLARKVMIDALNAPITAANQWLERSLDDSSNRRFVLAESFLIVDEILKTLHSLIQGFEINQPAIDKQLHENMHVLVSEALLMAITKKGGDRQVWHEHIRQCAMSLLSDPSLSLIERLQSIEGFPLTNKEITTHTSLSSISGMASQQAHHYVEQVEKQLKEIHHD